MNDDEIGVGVRERVTALVRGEGCVCRLCGGAGNEEFRVCSGGRKAKEDDTTFLLYPTR